MSQVVMGDKSVKSSFVPDGQYLINHRCFNLQFFNHVVFHYETAVQTNLKVL